MKVARAGSGIHLESGGGPGPTVVFLHGSAASAAVWKPLTRALAGRRPDAGWLLADLPGHGRSRWQLDYSPAGYADSVAAAIRENAADHPVHLVGHSLGAMVALALADGTRGVTPASVLVLAMKVSWTEAELTRRAAAATRPIRIHPGPERARELFGLISGMGAGFTEEDLDSGITVAEGGYRLSGDPRITAAPPATAAELAALAARAGCPVRLACGDRDPGIRYGDLADALGRPVTVLPDTAHNAHIEHPDLVAELVEQALR
ncbi:alpha/beta hydrolase [Acrocarpospora corrugata]|uniref:Alpha/beta hydrolase n=1 Tax=Acrocarpospora corrugata TaxID=35763 RepID=A0A5M3VSK6_9ACTN|nr:alpha/beta hydrolase [Acrocarpospora corrugata]GER99188.1 alpha/beta hydrolase [Acrocarpospora corrugata]